uniref:hypothetical protein n=1 Tax=Candidatus Cryptobacteroides bacterium TaxID=3085639 RepID=UPI0040253D07
MKQVALLLLLLISVTISAQNAEKKIAILKVIDRDENVTQGLKLTLRSRLTIAVTATPGYIGLDRVDIDAVLSEQNFQRSGLVKESQIKQLGVALGADLVMVAEAAWLNFYKTELVISAKLIDVESFQVVKTAMITTAVNSFSVNENCHRLARLLLKPSNVIQQTPGSGIIPKY